ncbi:Hypothetical predicted protein [Mytilus galloprovincialis]|uniref:Apple domain-containing protein n=1 Tax=Mytilus galloprovincialis TaxID=29158 RepID=A0A8B6FMF6_MYTGA|nr:Hypothetical predicted protein [Mytilus galloprovincialis]
MVCLVAGGSFHSGQYLESQILKVFFNVGPRMCMLRCTRYAGCTALNFVKSHLYCELLNATQQATTIDKEHYMYSEMSTWAIVGSFCLCGNVLIEIKYPKIPEAGCDYDCNGEPGRKCGSDWKNSIYLETLTKSRLETFIMLAFLEEHELLPFLKIPPLSRPPLSRPSLSNLNYTIRVPVKIISEPSG